MKTVQRLWPVLLLLLSSMACTITLPLPDVRIPRLPTLEVGTMQEYREEVPLAGVTEARVEISLGTGELTLSAGEPDKLFSGRFRTNVPAWAPEVTWQDGVLKVKQRDTAGIPGAGAENEWDLRFAPGVPLDMVIQIGAARGRLDMSGLALTDLSLETGASDLVVSWDEKNPVSMDRLLLRAGAANMEVRGIGYASPREVRVEGGVGSIVLDFGGPWSDPSQVRITAGVGSLTLRFPEDVGVRIVIECGLGDVKTGPGWRLSDGAYVNDACEQSGATLQVTLTAGVGSVTVE